MKLTKKRLIILGLISPILLVLMLVLIRTIVAGVYRLHNAYVHYEHRQEVAQLTEKCYSDDATACFKVGHEYSSVSKIYSTSRNWANMDPAEADSLASEFYQKACDLNHGKSCAFRGDTEKDSAQKVYYYTKACDLGEHSACADLGTLYYVGIGVIQSDFLATEYTQKACDLEGGWTEPARRGLSPGWRSCYMTGLAYYEGKGALQDKVLAKEYFGKACRFGFNNEEACNLYRGQAVRHKSLEAIYLKNACYIHGDSCAVLGNLYQEGKGVTQNYHEAFALYKKACDLDSIKGCLFLGLAYYEGKGVRQDNALAKEAFGKACDLGNQQGCDAYALLQGASVN